MKRYLCLALLALAAASAVASEIALDLRPRAVRTRGVAAPRATQTEEEAGTLRQTVLDAGAASTGSLAVGDVLRLSVYDDVSLSLTLVAREEAPLARASFQAEVSGANWRDAVRHGDGCGASRHGDRPGERPCLRGRVVRRSRDRPGNRPACVARRGWRRARPGT